MPGRSRKYNAFAKAPGGLVIEHASKFNKFMRREFLGGLHTRTLRFICENEVHGPGDGGQKSDECNINHWFFQKFLVLRYIVG